MHNFIKMGVINVCKDPEHLLVYRFAGLEEGRWEATLLPNPVPWLTSHGGGCTTVVRRVRRWSDKRGCGSWSSLRRENCLVIQSIIDPSHDVLYIGWRW